MTKQYYFDHAASAPRRDAVTDAMARWQHGVVGNPSGSHKAAREARRAVEEARDAGVGQLEAAAEQQREGAVQRPGREQTQHRRRKAALLARLIRQRLVLGVAVPVRARAVPQRQHKVMQRCRKCKTGHVSAGTPTKNRWNNTPAAGG